MTKQEKIQEAYGEHWEDLKDYVDENGWLIYSKSRPITLVSYFDVNEIEFDGFCSRPKSLQGIENNNGWIKIESEADLPNDEKSYWVVNDEKEIFEMEYFPNYKAFTEEGVTHYQPINKPLKPLY